MNNVIIRTENLVKSFTNVKSVRLEILRSISLEIIEGKITLIIGASGAGKSTLLHLLGGLDRPDSGKIFFRNEDLFSFSDEKLSRFRSKNIGFIFQFHHLLPEFTALENIAIPQMIIGKRLEHALSDSEKLLTEVGLSDRKDHKPAELSGGEQQRIAVARALANDPQLILADEPTGNLDTVNSQAITNLLVQLNRKFQKTFIIVTHNKEMLGIADYVYEMKDGKLLNK